MHAQAGCRWLGVPASRTKLYSRSAKARFLLLPIKLCLISMMMVCITLVGMLIRTHLSTGALIFEFNLPINSSVDDTTHSVPVLDIHAPKYSPLLVASYDLTELSEDLRWRVKALDELQTQLALDSRGNGVEEVIGKLVMDMRGAVECLEEVSIDLVAVLRKFVSNYTRAIIDSNLLLNLFLVLSMIKVAWIVV